MAADRKRKLASTWGAEWLGGGGEWLGGGGGEWSMLSGCRENCLLFGGGGGGRRGVRVHIQSLQTEKLASSGGLQSMAADRKTWLVLGG